MISPVESFILTCDNCQEHYEDGNGFGIFPDDQAMVETSHDEGWHEKDGKHYCDQCAKINQEIDDKLDIDESRFVPIEEDETPSLAQAYPLIDKFMAIHGMSLMHIEMWLSERHNMVARSQEEDDEIGDELDRLRDNANS